VRGKPLSKIADLPGRRPGRSVFKPTNPNHITFTTVQNCTIPIQETKSSFMEK